MKITDLYMYAIFAAFTVIIGVSLWRFQRREGNDFDLLDLLMSNGRVSRMACAFSLALAVTSWIMLKLTIDQKMTEGYLGIYGGLWITPIISKMFATSSISEKETK